jgi:hypothetical protein
MPRIELLKTLRNALIGEQEKRMRQRGLEPGLDGRMQLYVRLDRMRENRERLNNPYPEVTAAEKDDLVRYLAERAAATAKV